HRSAREGWVVAEARGVHLGRTLASYDIAVRHEVEGSAPSAGELVCSARLTCIIRGVRLALVGGPARTSWSARLAWLPRLARRRVPRPGPRRRWRRVLRRSHTAEGPAFGSAHDSTGHRRP